MRIPPFEPARRDESNGGIPILPRPLDAELIDKISLNQCFSTAPSRRPAVIEEWEYHHSNRLVEASRMVVDSSLYDHWMPS